ncbi:MAG: calcium-binding protein, partial [Chloroflexia bacterium]|nr:calcium-binding protein [Chloroflexia bacterium]
MKIIVDAYEPEEQALGWYYYLENNVSVPFRAKCSVERVISPLRVDDEVEVVGMAPEDECEHEMFVMTRWEQRDLAVPLAQLAGIDIDDESRQALDDWSYWVER